MTEETVSRETQQWWCDHIVAPMMNSHRMTLSGNLIAHQIHGYELFVFKYLPDIIKEYSKVSLWYGTNPATGKFEFLPQDRRQFATHFIKFQFTAIRYHKSEWTAKECHMRDETYKFDVVADIHITVMNIPTKTCSVYRRPLFYNVLLCSIPILVRSKMCADTTVDLLDPGGYFILEGKEKVVIAQEEYKYNHPFVMKPSSTKHNRYVLKCEVRSSNFPVLRSTSTVYILLKKQTNDIDIELPFCEALLPILAIFRMMGVDDRHVVLSMLTRGFAEPAFVEIMTRIVDHHIQTRPIEELAQIFVPKTSTVEKVLEHAAQQQTETKQDRKSLFQNTLTNEFFPHIGKQWTPKINHKKLNYLSKCIRKLVLVHLHETKQMKSQASGPIHNGRNAYELDNRDLMDNKRIKCTGYLIGLRFREIFRNYSSLLFRNIRNKFNKQLALLRPNPQRRKKSLGCKSSSSKRDHCFTCFNTPK